MMRSTHTRRARRESPWQFHPAVPHQCTRWCTILLAPPTSRVSISTSTSSSNRLPAHISTRTSMQHQRLYLHHCLCCACLRQQLLEPCLATSSTVVEQATSLESGLLQGRTRLWATSTIHHMVSKGLQLPRLVASTMLQWRMFLRESKSSLVHFLYTGTPSSSCSSLVPLTISPVRHAHRNVSWLLRT
jgi:hypothetical protein